MTTKEITPDDFEKQCHQLISEGCLIKDTYDRWLQCWHLDRKIKQLLHLYPVLSKDYHSIWIRIFYLYVYSYYNNIREYFESRKKTMEHPIPEYYTNKGLYQLRQKYCAHPEDPSEPEEIKAIIKKYNIPSLDIVKSDIQSNIVTLTKSVNENFLTHIKAISSKKET